MSRLLVVVVVLAGTTAAAGSAATARAPHGPLTGKWKGVLTDGTQKERITITVNGRETHGTWKVNASCHGRLTLKSISNGYHHYRRHRARGSTCAGGDIDCLERTGAKVADSVTPRPNGWSRSGTLHRVRRK
jgi:hypothetical protein